MRYTYLGLNNIDATSSLTGQTTIYANQPSGFVVTATVKAWKAGAPNYGVVIWATNENKMGRGTRFASKSASDVSRHAFIILNCNNDVTSTPSTSTTSTTARPITVQRGGGDVTI